MHECSTGQLLAGAALVHHDDKCHLLATCVLKGLICYSWYTCIVPVCAVLMYHWRYARGTANIELRWVATLCSKLTEFLYFFSTGSLNHIESENTKKNGGSRATFLNIEFWKFKVFSFFSKNEKKVWKLLWFYFISTIMHRNLKHHIWNAYIFPFAAKIILHLHAMAFWVKISCFGKG